MPQGLSQLSRNVARHTTSAKDVAHARTLLAQVPFNRGGADCKGLSDYLEASGLWDGGASGPLSGFLGARFWALEKWCVCMMRVVWNRERRYVFGLVEVRGGSGAK